MFKLSKKGGFIAGVFMLIIASVAVISTILFFFFSFKIQTRSESYDEYLWSKVQEVPLSLFSVDFKDETFVTKMNLIYFEKEEEDLEMLGKTLKKQLLYLTEDSPNLGFIILIDEISIEYNSEFPDCRCKPDVSGSFYYCSNGCIEGKANELCQEIILGQVVPVPEKCYNIGSVEYSKSYPIPLVFSGKDEFLVDMSYKAIENK